MVQRLDANLRKFAECGYRQKSEKIFRISMEAEQQVQWEPVWLLSLIQMLQMGIETVLDIVKFDELIQGADLIFTGEGKMDSQSLRGKVVIGVGKRAKRQDIPVVVVTGDAEEVEDAYDMGISAVFSTNRVARDFSVIRYKSKEYMEVTMDNIMRLIKIVNK